MKETISVLIPEKEIEKRVCELAEQISKDFEGKSITLICILKGGVMFLVDLAKRIRQNVEFDFMDVSSYGNSTESSGNIKILMDIDEPIKDKNIIIIEAESNDIIENE